jgi:hypothetical protein
MAHPKRPTRPRRRGSYAIEFALCFTMWWIAVVSITEYSWMFFHQLALDAASNEGCRAGSLRDPGRNDQRIAVVEAAATEEMLDYMVEIGLEPCDDCEVRAETVGRPPHRSLRCSAIWEVESLSGVLYDTRTLESMQVARLEWQREAPPE